MSRTNDRDAVDLMHLMGHLYLKSGQTQRGMVLLLIAIRMAPEHKGVLRALCHGFLAQGSARRAINTIERLEALDEREPTLWLLKGRAHLADGERDLARRCYREYVRARSARGAGHDGVDRESLVP